MTKKSCVVSTLCALSLLTLAGCGPKDDAMPSAGPKFAAAPSPAAPPSQAENAQQGQAMADYMKRTHGGKK